MSTMILLRCSRTSMRRSSRVSRRCVPHTRPRWATCAASADALPGTLRGWLMHGAEHGMRHLGLLIVTASTEGTRRARDRVNMARRTDSVRAPQRSGLPLDAHQLTPDERGFSGPFAARSYASSFSANAQPTLPLLRLLVPVSRSRRCRPAAIDGNAERISRPPATSAAVRTAACR